MMSKRNSTPLSKAQVEEVRGYIDQYSPVADIHIIESADMNTGFSTFFGKGAIAIGPDVFPLDSIGDVANKANARLSARASIAHELVGHAEVNMAGRSRQKLINGTPGYATKRDWLIEEAEASLRAAHLADGLSSTERIMLAADAVTRLRKGGLSLQEVYSEMWFGRWSNR